MKNLILIFLLTSNLIFSQGNIKIERIKALRVAFISSKLELSPTEAEKFWPIFNQFDKKNLELKMQFRQLKNKLKDNKSENLSETEMQSALDNSEKLETEIQNNQKELIKSLKGIIPANKIMVLKTLDEEFKKNIFRQVRENRRRRE